MNSGTAFRLRTLLKEEGRLAYIRLNNQTPCLPRGAACRAIALSEGESRLNQGHCGLLFLSPHSVRLSHGCDRPHSFASPPFATAAVSPPHAFPAVKISSLKITFSCAGFVGFAGSWTATRLYAKIKQKSMKTHDSTACHQTAVAAFQSEIQ